MSFRKIIILALLIRILLLPFSFHGDLNNNAIWGIYAKEFGLRGFYDWLNFGNYARPDYPPLSIILFLLIRWIWQFLFNIFWYLNIQIPLFPSDFIFWFEKYGYLFLLKFPGVLADAGTGLLIYKWLKQKNNERLAKYGASLFLFNPPIIYISSLWGQLDPVVGFFALAATIFVIRKKYLTSLGYIFISIMIKVTMILTIPILVFQSLKNRVSYKVIFSLAILLLVFLSVLGFFFTDSSPVFWIINTYWKKFIPGPATLPYINLNAFNFWGIILGLERISDNTKFVDIPISSIAWILSFVFFTIILFKFWKGQDIFFSLLMMFFAAFVFMPRVHERYLYPIFVFFPLVLVKYPNLKKNFILLSTIFLINLYHLWWFPRIEILVTTLKQPPIERGLSLAVAVSFLVLFKKYALLRT